MKRIHLSTLLATVVLGCLPRVAEAGPLTVIHSWSMGEEEEGTPGTPANGTLLDTVGELHLEPTGPPEYASLGAALGVFFNNQDSAHNMPATEFYSSEEADVTPIDTARWGIEAIVRIDQMPATNQEFAVIELGAGSSGILLQTYGNGSWGLHRSGVAITSDTNPVLVGQTQHLAAVLNEGSWQLWVDGLLAASFADPGYDPAAGIRIGAGNTGPGNNRGFNGVIEAVRIFEYEDTFDINETLLGVLNPDKDGDGFDDAVEIELGFDPNNPASTPESKTDIRTAVEFSFWAAKNQKYTIEQSADLTTWTAIEEGITGRGGEITRLYSTAAQPNQHYRAVRQ